MFTAPMLDRSNENLGQLNSQLAIQTSRSSEWTPTHIILRLLWSYRQDSFVAPGYYANHVESKNIARDNRDKRVNVE